MPVESYEAALDESVKVLVGEFAVAAWMAGESIAVGNKREWDGTIYIAIRAHTSATGDVVDGRPDQDAATAWEVDDNHPVCLWPNVPAPEPTDQLWMRTVMLPAARGTSQQLRPYVALSQSGRVEPPVVWALRTRRHTRLATDRPLGAAVSLPKLRRPQVRGACAGPYRRAGQSRAVQLKLPVSFRRGGHYNLSEKDL